MKKSKRKRTPAHTNALQALEVSESKWLPVTLCPVKAKDGGGAARRGVRTGPTVGGLESTLLTPYTDSWPRPQTL